MNSITTFGNKGNFNVIYPTNYQELLNIFLEYNKNKTKYALIGGGSNTLINEEYNGKIIKLTKMKYNYQILSDCIYTSAFYPTTNFVLDISQKGFDYSFLAGIPGLIGGAIFNNSGAFEKNIGDFILYVDFLNKAGKITRFYNDNLLFSYRYSIFKDIEGIIIGAAFKKIPGTNIKEKINQNLEIRRKKLPNNLSLGSVFKNNQLVKAWRVISELNLRGYQLNDAAFSNKHANIIINLGDAKFKDAYRLIRIAKEKAMDKFGIKLEEEISIIE